MATTNTTPDAIADDTDLVTYHYALENISQKNPNEFTPKEDDSLFQIVTKAYLRNYDKVNLEK